MGAIQLERFSTLSQPGSARLESWNRFVGGLFDGMTVAANQNLDASWLQFRFGDVGLASAKSQKALIERPAGYAQGRSDRLILLLQHRGRSLTSQGQGSAMLAPGDLTIVRAVEAYKISITDRSQVFVLDCDPVSLGLSEGDANALRVHRLEGSRVAVALLRDFVSSVLNKTWEADPTEEEGKAVGDVILRLVGSCVTAREPAGECAGRATRARVMTFVEQRLNEPDLRTGMIARALSLSPRTVQEVFAEMATTPTAYIQSRRLAAAAERLDQSSDFGSLTDLAFDLGFSDSTYFCRCFKAEYGMTPSAYRRRPRP